MTLKNWASIAFNQVPESDNRIHSDELAKAYGFTGALVPGVTQSAYLLHPIVEAWGMDWLERGTAHVKVLAPLYDARAFTVSVTAASENACQAQLNSENRLCAVAEVNLPLTCAESPAYQFDALLDAAHTVPEATRKHMENLQENGCAAVRFTWSAQHEMANYLRDHNAMPLLLRTEPLPDSGGYANPSFLLGCANRHFAAVARMSPWIHLETRSRNFQSVALNTELVSEMRINDLFNKKGHEFADCTFNLFRADTLECVCSIEQRAIYRLRKPE